MSNVCFLFSLCIITVTVSYTTWVNFNKFMKWHSSEEKLEFEIHRQYYDFLSKFNKKYGREEFLKRIEYFKQTLKELSRLETLEPGVYGLNKFSDMSEEEFRKNMLTPVVGMCRELHRYKCPPRRNKNKNKRTNSVRGSRRNSTFYSKSNDIPRTVDWRKHGVVSKVLNQKLCHCCWAMAIVGVMESMDAKKTGHLYPLSSQELIDCSTNAHCNRGDVRETLNFLCLLDYPVVHEHDYPLTLIGDEACRIPKNKEYYPSGVRIQYFHNQCNMKEDEMLRIIANHGPIVVVVNANSWYFYNNGVIQRACANSWGYMNHVVQIVGYDLDAEVPHYIVRNSWGEDFGENGYLRLAINGNVCGVANNVAYFDVK